MESSAELLQTARKMSGLTQVELAAAAHVPQSVISAYETGRREPALSTLQRLISAAKATLVVKVAASSDSRRKQVLDAADQIKELSSKYGYSNPQLFGSVARGEDTTDSDIDLLVTGKQGLFQLCGLQHDLEQLLEAKVDVVPQHALKPHIREHALAEALPL